MKRIRKPLLQLFPFRILAAGIILGAVFSPPVKAQNSPQWGALHTRNMISTATGLPNSFNPDTGENIKWTASLGSHGYATPVISGGKVLIGTKKGDITKSGEIWSQQLERHSTATAAIANGLVYVTDCGKNLHCIDAESGKVYWKHQMKMDSGSSAPVADKKVYVASRGGDFWILKEVANFIFYSPLSCKAR